MGLFKKKMFISLNFYYSLYFILLYFIILFPSTAFQFSSEKELKVLLVLFFKNIFSVLQHNFRFAF